MVPMGLRITMNKEINIFQLFLLLKVYKFLPIYFKGKMELFSYNFNMKEFPFATKKKENFPSVLLRINLNIINRQIVKLFRVQVVN